MSGELGRAEREWAKDCGEHEMRSNPCIIIERDGARPNMSGELGRAEREWAEDCGSMECGAIRVSS